MDRTTALRPEKQRVEVPASPAVTLPPRFQRRGMLTVDVEQFASTAVVRAEGDVDLASVHELTAALDRVELGSITLLVVDIGEVGFLDLSGLNAILKLNEECKGNDVHLSVIAPRGAGKRVFTLTHTDRELDLVDAGVPADR
jgi:anti-sigma B factor antagonist